MTTVETLINKTLHTYLGVRNSQARNKLNGELLADAETIPLSYPLNTLQAGSKLSIGLEDMHVWSASPSPVQADVERGSFGTSAAVHADGSIVEVDAAYSPAEVLAALNATVSDLTSEGLFQSSSINLTVVAGVMGYDLTGATNVLKIYDAESRSPVSSTKEWVRFEHFDEMLSADTSEFASGAAIVFRGARPAPGTTLRVHYRHELNAGLSALDDVVETVVGVESDAVNLLAIGAALHLIAGQEPARNQIGAAFNRRADEVPAGAWTQAGSNLRRLYNQSLQAERARLARKFPVRLSMRSPLTSRY